MSEVRVSDDFTFERFYSTVNGYYRTAAVKVAIELGIFNVVGRAGKTVDEIATACGASLRGIRIICYYLTSIGFMRLNGDRFFLDRNMEMFLDSRSPGYLGGSIDFLLSPYIMGAFDDLTAVVQTGRLTLPADGVVAPDHPQWVAFARAMAPMMALPSALIADTVTPPPDRPLKVLDVAAGHGLFGLAFAQRFRDVEVTFQDWENVLEVARENVEAAGLSSMAHFLPGNAFDVDFGKGYDVVLLPNFLHHFDRQDCQVILAKVLEALVDDGLAIIFEFIADEDRIAPPVAATFSMMMLATTPAGEVYTYGDLAEMAMNVGYGAVELRPIPPALEKVVVAHRRPL